MSTFQFLLWLPMILLAVLNGLLREYFFRKWMNELSAHQLSTLFLMVLCFLYVWLIFPFLRIENDQNAWVVGVVWVILTIVFEFLIGLMSKKSKKMIFKDYHLSAGRIWVLFLIFLGLVPYLVYILNKG
ncbi:MAG: hypothetical protein KF829_09420 [Ferruginibacter sp.]|nr:hypothetical protein [Ferruginibacter sp.]